MIHNLTKAEWRALAAAIEYYVTLIDDDPERYRGRGPALERAYTKARQLAPEGE